MLISVKKKTLLQWGWMYEIHLDSSKCLGSSLGMDVNNAVKG